MYTIEKFSLDDHEYSGYVISSLNITPHYHWFVFENEELKQKFGDEVGFIFSNGKLRPVNPVLAEKHEKLFEEIRKIVHRHIFQ